MKRAPIRIAITLLLTSVAYGCSAADTETIPLRFLGAKDMLTSVKTPPGIEEITLHFNDNSVTVRGSRDAVVSFRAVLAAADVQPISYRAAMRLIRCHVDTHGKVIETVVMQPTVLDLDQHEANVTVTQGNCGYAILFTPRRVDGKTLMLTVETRELGDQGEVVRSGKNARPVLIGQTVRITGMTDATDKVLRRAVQRGGAVADRGAYTATYVEVTTTIPENSGTQR